MILQKKNSTEEKVNNATKAYKEHIMYSFNGFCKGESMNKDTSKTSHTTALLDVKPDLVKRVGNTTFDIHIHFSETSRETFTDKVVRLIENDKDSVTN